MKFQLQFVKDLQGGGFGKIKLFYDARLNKNFVQKSLLNPIPENCERLIREGKMYMQLAMNPNIVDIAAYDFNPTNPSLLLPYYELGTLQNRVGSCTWLDTISILQNCAAGLRDLHKVGGIHRDVKPSNIFLENIPQGTQAKLGDFGLGRLPFPFTNGDVTRHACGTPDYIAPELYADNAQFTSACDIYSLGITGIELITGNRNPNSICSAWINGDAKNLLLRMTDRNPNMRPTAKSIVREARNMVETHNKSVNAVVTLAGIGLITFLLTKGAKS